MKKKIIALLSAMLALPATSLAAVVFHTPDAPKTDWLTVGLATYIEGVFGNVINVVWIIFGGFAVTMFVYAGYLFLNSHGEPSRLKGARDALIWGSIGVAIALMAEIIPYFVKFILNFD